MAIERSSRPERSGLGTTHGWWSVIDELNPWRLAMQRVLEVTRLLRIEAPHFVAGIVFTRTVSGWRVTQAAPIIHYMTPWPPERIKVYLQQKGWAWAWLENS